MQPAAPIGLFGWHRSDRTLRIPSNTQRESPERHEEVRTSVSEASRACSSVTAVATSVVAAPALEPCRSTEINRSVQRTPRPTVTRVQRLVRTPVDP